VAGIAVLSQQRPDLLLEVLETGVSQCGWYDAQPESY